MFNVLDSDGKNIKVKEIDVTKHRHFTGRPFNQDDACVKNGPVVITKDNILELAKEAKKTLENQTNELTVMTKEEATELYTEKYGRKPHPNSKLETIIKKLG